MLLVQSIRSISSEMFMKALVEIRLWYAVRYIHFLLLLITMLTMYGVFPPDLIAQQSKVDSLHKVLGSTSHDTTKVNALCYLSELLSSSDPDSAIVMANRALNLAKSAGYHEGEADALIEIGIIELTRGDYYKALERFKNAQGVADEYQIREMESTVLTNIGNVHADLGDNVEALKYYQKSLEINRQSGDRDEIGGDLLNIGTVYSAHGDDTRALSFYRQALDIFEESEDKLGLSQVLNNIGTIYLVEQDYDKALEHFESALKVSEELDNHYAASFNLLNIGSTYAEMGEYLKALEYAQRSLQIGKQIGDKRGIAEGMISLGEIYTDLGRYGDALAYGREAHRITTEIGALEIKMVASEVMYSAFKGQHRSDSALAYFEEYIALNDSLLGESKQNELNRMTMKYEVKQREQKIALQKAELGQARLLQFSMIGGLIVLLIFAGGLYRRYLFKKRTSEQLQTSYDLLKRTQQQLIHAEKMATLGELTAGVAHEIKNPLNFITNFAALIERMAYDLEEQASGQDEMTETIAMLIMNTSKIREHGKHADSIVNSMLAHSREVKGEQQETKINDLVREAVGLAQHGAGSEAKVELLFHLDEQTGEATILPAQISRVMVNLVANAIYSACTLEGSTEPRVQVSTTRLGEEIHISVTDNGSGMSADVKEKIFQPFFTTKPTGMGVGLGLSLCWDIVTSGHNGTIEVVSEEGKGATFTVKLPVG
jgi:two-component system, NtrC family, sensor kinase